MKEIKRDAHYKKGYAINAFEDPDAINSRLKNLRESNIFDLRDDAHKEVLNYFETKCTESKKITTEGKKYIPGGVQHNLAFNYPFPICMEKAEGAYLYDRDGNKYIDFLQAGGPTVLGSNYPSVREKIIELLNTCGPVTGLFHEAEMLLAREICNSMPAVEKFRMLGSGTEAVMGALRIARCATGNKRIIKMGGAYHGWSDQMVYGTKIPGSRGLLESHGIPKGSLKYTDEVRPNDLNMLEFYLKKNKLKGGTAAVIVEGVGAESGTRPISYDYNKKALELAHKYGALFIMDEVVTGFRMGPGGAQGYFGIEPDVTIFGKVIAGGYPAAGGIGGKKEYIDLLAAGVATLAKRAYVGGTLAANPLSSLAGYLTIKEIKEQNACEKAGIAGDKLRIGLERLIEKHKLPYVVYNQGSILHLECTAAMSFDYSSRSFLKSALGLLKNKDDMTYRKVVMEHLGAAYMSQGIVTLAGSRVYTSLATTDPVIDAALEGFDKVFGMIEKKDPEKIKAIIKESKEAKKAQRAALKAQAKK